MEQYSNDKNGRLPEWFKGPILKIGDGLIAHQAFKSLTCRHQWLTASSITKKPTIWILNPEGLLRDVYRKVSVSNAVVSAMPSWVGQTDKTQYKSHKTLLAANKLTE